MEIRESWTHNEILRRELLNQMVHFWQSIDNLLWTPSTIKKRIPRSSIVCKHSHLTASLWGYNMSIQTSFVTGGSEECQHMSATTSISEAAITQRMFNALYACR